MICERCGCKIIRPSDSPYLCAYCYSISHPQSAVRSFAGYQNRDNAIAPRVAHSSLAHGGFFFRSTLDRENLTLSTADFSPVRLPIGMCDASLNATSAGEKSFSQAVAERLPARVPPAMDGRFSICPVAVETLLETEGLIERSAAGQFNLGGGVESRHVERQLAGLSESSVEKAKRTCDSGFNPAATKFATATLNLGNTESNISRGSVRPAHPFKPQPKGTMKLILLALMFCAVTGCDRPRTPLPEDGLSDLQSVTLEGCQYWKYRIDGYAHYGIVHKGNCTNHNQGTK